MAIDKSTLSKGHIRKLEALRKSLGEKIADEAFAKWLKEQESKELKSKPDITAQKLQDAVSALQDSDINLGTYGYTIRKSKGKGARGFVITKNTRAV